jgi:hypothetical protein
LNYTIKDIPISNIAPINAVVKVMIVRGIAPTFITNRVSVFIPIATKDIINAQCADILPAFFAKSGTIFKQLSNANRQNTTKNGGVLALSLDLTLG